MDVLYLFGRIYLGIIMRTLAILVAAASLLLSGCATTIRSDVTTFQQWPASLPEKTYVFEAPPASADDTLELRTYQAMVAGELAKLGFTQAADGASAKLRVGVHFSTIDRPTKVLRATDPFWMGSPYWGPRYYGHGFYRRGYYRPYFGAYRYSPFYDPFWDSPLEMQETILHNYERQLRVAISTIDGKKLFDVTVQNTSRKRSTPMVMPALVQSAFTGFPGENGKVKQVEFTLQ